MDQNHTAANIQDLSACFWKVTRNEQLRYYIKLSSIISEATSISNHHLPKCRYCKAFPFNIQQTHATNTAKQCQMCGSINQYQMRHTLLEQQSAATWFQNYSYIIPCKQTSLLEVKAIVIIDLDLSIENIQMLMHGLSAVLINQYFKIAIVLIFNGNLGIVSFDDDCSLIYLTEDLCLKQQIEQYFTQITLQQVQALQKIVNTLKQTQTKEMNNLRSICSVLSSYDRQTSNSNFMNIFIWIGKLPSQNFELPKQSIYTVAVLVSDKKLQNLNHLIDLKLNFSEFHLIEGEDQPTQLYYKIFEILDGNRYANIITSQVIIKTNRKYSGTIKNYPFRVINSSSPLTEIETSTPQKHKIQIYFEYYNCESAARYFVVINLEDKALKRNELFEKSIMINRALRHVVQQYKLSKCSAEKRRTQFDYFFIVNCLKQYGNQFQNNTKLYEQLIKWMSEYFKQFQRDIPKLYTPFSLLGKTSILFIFYPIYTKSGLLHHYSGYSFRQQIDHQLQAINQLFQIFYSPQQLKPHIFYRLCKENQNIIRYQTNYS